MRANVPDDRLRGRQRAEKRHGHSKGGNASWRNYEATKAKRAAKAAHNRRAASWWLGLSREAFVMTLKARHPLGGTEQD